VSAIKVTSKLDAGPIYMKKPLSLEGSAGEIFIRCCDVIFNEMLPVFFKEKPIATPQQGEPVIFKRRKPEDGKLTLDMEIDKIYDYIRMLDAEGYPKAFMEFGDYRLEFDKASYNNESGNLEAHVTFIKQATEDE
jgi:methionyl-tRNA formyltransferase